MHCNRTACQREVTDTYVKIWNEPSRITPNIYCTGCGNKIIYHNPSLTFEKIVAGVAYPERKKNVDCSEFQFAV